MVARPRDPAWSGTLYIVVNAGTKDADFARIATAAGSRATLNRADDGALLALQGPEAAAVMRDLVPAAVDLGFMTYGSFAYGGTKLVISRSGYTGEDGFEILVPPDTAETLWDRLLADARVKPIGLGARDSLRLEAGLPLYGHDLDETVSPIEASLGFAVSKRRREAADFPGARRILKEYAGDLSRVRVGLLVEGAPAREGAEILDAAGDRHGHQRRLLALAQPPDRHGLRPAGARRARHEARRLGPRGRAQAATVTPLPFVPHRYFRKPA